MIFVDSNVPMYLVGASHPHKVDAQRLLEQLTVARERLVTDAEVFQEIVHRYCAIDRRDAIQPCFDALDAIVDETFAITRVDVNRAKDVVLGHPRLSARDAIHVAVMEREGVERILTFDHGYDVVPGVVRVS